MAQTWRGSSAAFPESKFDEGSKDTSASQQIHYDVRRNGNQVLFSVTDEARSRGQCLSKA